MSLKLQVPGIVTGSDNHSYTSTLPAGNFILYFALNIFSDAWLVSGICCEKSCSSTG
ncbi:MAG: hypothetical protein WKF89_04770 [Chitinophagaceae bacterium]